MEEFLKHYGLIAVYLGMWFEGETVLVISGFLVHQGMLPRWEVFFVTMLGALSVDHVIFIAGHFSSRIPLLQRWSTRNAKLQARVTQLGASWPVFIGVRFVYGTRTPYLFFVGTRRLPWLKFFPREAVSVCFWCSAWLFFGHFFGHLMVLLYGHLRKHHLPWIILALAVSGVCVTAAILLARRRTIKKEASSGEAEVGEL